MLALCSDDMANKLSETYVCLSFNIVLIVLNYFKDIRNLIAEWVDEINECERIWIRASGSNRRIFMDYEAAVISKSEAVNR